MLTITLELALFALSGSGYLLTPYIHSLLGEQIVCRMTSFWCQFTSFLVALANAPAKCWNGFAAKYLLTQRDVALIRLAGQLQRELCVSSEACELNCVTLMRSTLLKAGQYYYASAHERRLDWQLDEGSDLTYRQHPPQESTFELVCLVQEEPLARVLNWLSCDLVCCRVDASACHLSTSSQVNKEVDHQCRRTVSSVDLSACEPRAPEICDAVDNADEQAPASEADDAVTEPGQVAVDDTNKSCEKSVGWMQPTATTNTTTSTLEGDGAGSTANRFRLRQRRRPSGSGERYFNEGNNNSGRVFYEKTADKEDEEDNIGNDFQTDRRQPSVHYARPIWRSRRGNSSSSATRREIILVQHQRAQLLASSAVDKTASDSGAESQRAASESFCLVEFHSGGQVDRFRKRSRLIFQFVQLWSEQLIGLHSLVSKLLERAGLIEPGAFCLWPQTGRPEGAGGVGTMTTTATTQRWLELVALHLVENLGDEHDEDEDAKRQCARGSDASGRGELLDRYSLALMIVAFLQHQKRRRAANRKGWRRRAAAAFDDSTSEQIELASNLLGFLEFYSSSSYVDGAARHQTSAPAQVASELTHNGQGPPATVLVYSSNSKVSVRLEVARSEGGRTLIVLDPVLTHSQKGGQVEGVEGTAPAELASNAANLTGNLKVWPQIGGLFARLRSTAERSLDRADNQCPEGQQWRKQQPPSSGLLEEASEHFRKSEASIRKCQIDEALRRARHELEHLKPEDASCNAPELVSTRLLDNQAHRSESIGHIAPSRRPSLQRKLDKLRRNRVVRSGFYLALFVIIRIVLIGYLAGLQRDLERQARDDLILLKRLVFPHWQTEELDQDDGISILLREERASSEVELDDEAGGKIEPEDGKISEAGEEAEQREVREREPSEEPQEMNQMIEVLLMSMLKEMLKGQGDGGLDGLDPKQLNSILGELAQDEEVSRELASGDDGEMAKMLKQMQLIVGAGSQSGDSPEQLFKSLMSELGQGGEEDEESEEAPAVEDEANIGSSAASSDEL